MESRKTFWDVKQEVGGKYSTSERLDVRKDDIGFSINKAVWEKCLRIVIKVG